MAVADGDADVLAAVLAESFFCGAVLYQYVVVCQEPEGEVMGADPVCQFAEEIVCLRRDDTKEWDSAEFFPEYLPLSPEFVACPCIVLFIFPIDLHVEFSEGVDVPYRHVLFHPFYQALIGGGKNAKTETGNTIGFGYAFHHAQMRVCLQQVIAQEGIVKSIVGEIDKRLIYYQLNAFLCDPLRKGNQIPIGDEIAGGIVGVHDKQRADVLVTEEVYKVGRGI